MPEPPSSDPNSFMKSAANIAEESCYEQSKKSKECSSELMLKQNIPTLD